MVYLIDYYYTLFKELTVSEKIQVESRRLTQYCGLKFNN